MTATDLMIGDWVAYNGDVDYTNPIRIEGMDIATGMCITSDRDDVGFDGVEPIPLTEDILDKNFKDIAEPHQRIYGGRWVYYDEYIEIEITEYTDGLWQVEVDEIEMSGLPSWRMYATYVHQLQHALRLCNIDKEIEI